MQAPDRSVGQVERMLLLKKIPMLRSLATSELGLVAESMRERFFSEGSTLLREGEPVGAMYYVVDGKVRIRRGGHDLGHAFPGAGVAGLGLLARDERGIEAVAETDTLTLEHDVDTVFELFEDHFSILRNTLREVCRAIIELFVRSPTAGAVRLPRQLLVTPDGELDLVGRIFLLRQVGTFARSSINALAELSRGMSEVSFEPGVTLWSREDPARGVFLIVRGQVRCTLGDARSFPLGPGEAPGTIEAIAGVPHWYEALTETPVTALTADIEGLIDVFEDNFEMAMDFLAVMSRWWLCMLDTGVPLRGEGPLPKLYVGEHG